MSITKAILYVGPLETLARKADVDHVSVDGFDESNTGVEAFGDCAGR
jgi:hypothetical protein